MISNELVADAIIAALKADADLVAWLTARSSADEIRENQWQGRDFTYPAVRLDLGDQVEVGNDPCFSEIPFTVFGFAEGDSSRDANILAGLISAALVRTRNNGTGFTGGLVANDAMTGAARTGEKIWRAPGLYRMKLYGGIL